jgi:hypothetical protein
MHSLRVATCGEGYDWPIAGKAPYRAKAPNLELLTWLPDQWRLVGRTARTRATKRGQRCQSDRR